MMLVLIFFLGVTGGLAAGLLGIGGGILLAPLLLFLPPWLSLGRLSIHTVTGLTAVQDLAGSCAGFLSHRVHRRTADTALFVWLGLPFAVGQLLGAVYSAQVAAAGLTVLFALLCIGAGILMARSFLVPRPQGDGQTGSDRRRSRYALAGSGAVLGSLGGMVGQGGAFMVLPVMTEIFRVPTALAMTTMLAVMIPGSLGAAAGKLATAQVPPLQAAVLVMGSIVGAWAGTVWSGRVQTRTLRLALTAIIFLAGLQLVRESLPYITGLISHSLAGTL